MDHDYDNMGCRFAPTEKQIITHFLDGKMRGLVFSDPVINTLNICEFEPRQLLAQLAIRDDEECYFFSEINKKYANSDRVGRTTKAGYWKVIGKDHQIFDKFGKVIGVKKFLVFYEGRGSKATRTNWVIHEYHSTNASAYQKPYIFCYLRGNSGESSSHAAAGS